MVANKSASKGSHCDGLRERSPPRGLHCGTNSARFGVRNETATVAVTPGEGIANRFSSEDIIMTCQHCRELLTDYQHGELDAASDAVIFEHLQSCAGCREELAAQSALTESLRAAFGSELEMPTSILAGVRQAARRDRSAEVLASLRALLRPVVLAPAAAAIILVAGAISYVHNANNPNAEQQVSADYLVRQHVAHTMNSQSGDRAWNAYLLTSDAGDANAPSQ